MAAVKKQEIPMVAQFMTDFWEFVKSVWIVEHTETYWDDTVKRCEKLLTQYPEPFCRKQILCFLEYLETKERETKKQQIA